ncbi:hypothetical protein NMG60_11026099 [Bertholletia excelsa]
MVLGEDAAIGVLFAELVIAVKEMARNNAKFKSSWRRLGDILNRLEHVVNEIIDADRQLDRSNEERERLIIQRFEKGIEIVRRCAKVKCWNITAKYSYKKKLDAYERSLQDLFRYDLQLDRIGTGGSFGKYTGLTGCCRVPGVRQYVVGLEERISELKMLLLKNAVVVVSAPGGFGKTTLVKVLCNDEEITRTFEDILFVTVSNKSNFRAIIEKLFQHKGHPLPDFQTEEEAIDQLECLLMPFGSNPVLLVLDDLQTGLELFIDGLTCQIPKIKVLVTSRSVFPRFYTYELEMLKDQHAMALFRHSACQQDGSSTIPSDLVNEIVRYCRGSPLALTVVGRSLCGESVVTWKEKRKHWSQGGSVFHGNDKLLNCLLSSIIALDEVKKECYLDLGSFPEDQRISATTLMDMWVELYNMDEDGENAICILIQLCRRGLIDLVHTRKDLSDGDGNDDCVTQLDGCYTGDFVTQHDLLRDLAIHQSGQKPIQNRERLIIEIRGNDLPSWWTEQMEHPIHARLVSISTDEMFSSIWLNNFLLLGYLWSLKRIRLEHISVPSITPILQLRSLQKISFIMCKIAEGFRDYVIPTPNMLPNLAEIVLDYCNDLVEFPAWLCSIHCLKKLSITNCHGMVAIPEGFGKLESLEMLSLYACSNLEKLPESFGSLRKLSFLDISDCVNLNKLPGQIGELCGLTELHMRGCGLLKLPLSVGKLEQLKVVTCGKEIGYQWEDYKDLLPNLRIKFVKEEVNLDWLGM